MYSFRDQVFVPYNRKLRLSHSFSDYFTTFPPTPTNRLCLDGTADLSTALAGAEASLLALDNVRALLDELLTLGKDQLDVARVGHVGVDLEENPSQPSVLEQNLPDGNTYTTVGTVSTSATLGSLVDLDVLDNEVAGVETLGVGVGLGVLEEVDQELSGLDGPAGLADTPLLAWKVKRNWSADLFLPCVWIFPSGLSTNCPSPQ